MGFSRSGKPIRLSELEFESDTTFVIGGFPHGSFSDSVMDVLDECVSISNHTLDAWIVVSRVIAECERRMELL
ncbi:hypothetical protein DRN72_04600 [Methanosarcinales archaeon]|nr:MAG: hypothetical protein DRN72_04600 [Methanosarcinales archaeon]